MSAISITAGNVVKVAGAVVKQVVSSGTITQGMSVYRHTDGTYKPSDADAALSSVCDGIALTASATGQPLVIQTEGDITIGATVAAGAVYMASSTAGGLEVYSDLTGPVYSTVIAVAISTTVLRLIRKASVVAYTAP